MSELWTLTSEFEKIGLFMIIQCWKEQRSENIVVPSAFK